MRDELLMNMYELPFTTLPPTIFHVYLHPSDFERIEGIVPRMVAELQKALTEEVRRANERRTRPGRLLGRLVPIEGPPIEMPAAGWDVHIHADRNDGLQLGELGIESMLPLPAPLEFGGPPTTRIVRSVVTGTSRSSTTIEVQQAPAAPVAPDPATHERASLSYEDEQGPHLFSMRKDTLSVGRGGSSVWVDVQVVTSPKVSREHFRLRRDASGSFFIQDRSVWGTAVDGQPLPAAATGPDGVLQPGAEHPLPDTATIQLADAIVIRFQARRDA